MHAIRLGLLSLMDEAVDCHARRANRGGDRNGTDLLVLDLHMPHLSGFEIIDGLDSEIPTMMITADVSPKVRQRALRSGVELVAKPFQVDEVLGRIKRMLEARIQNVGVRPSERRLIRVPNLPGDRRHEEAAAVSGLGSVPRGTRR